MKLISFTLFSIVVGLKFLPLFGQLDSTVETLPSTEQKERNASLKFYDEFDLTYRKSRRGRKKAEVSPMLLPVGVLGAFFFMSIVNNVALMSGKDDVRKSKNYICSGVIKAYAAAALSNISCRGF